MYLVGYSEATWGSPVRAYIGDDAFAAKLNSSGALIWNTFLGAGGYDSGQGIAVDGSGNVYVAGNSNATWGAPVRLYDAGGDAYAAKLDSSGALIWNTFLGAGGYDVGYGIALDGGGNVYLVGYSKATWGTGECTGCPLRAYTTGGDGFAAKLANDVSSPAAPATANPSKNTGVDGRYQQRQRRVAQYSRWRNSSQQ